MNQREVLIIYCMGFLLLCFFITPVLGADELMYSASVGAPLIPDQLPIGTDASLPITTEGSVLTMIQRLKGISPGIPENTGEMAPKEGKLDVDHLVAAVQDFDGTAVMLDENGNYIPIFPSNMYAQGIVATSFQASGVEGYSDGTITSSYSFSDNTRVAGYISQYAKQYHYKSGVDACVDGAC